MHILVVLNVYSKFIVTVEQVWGVTASCVGIQSVATPRGTSCRAAPGVWQNAQIGFFPDVLRYSDIDESPPNSPTLPV
ncbi:hypothetical protein J6590_020295 [Homalodisca vitripennis]|nr:hypothetical protein J6590_020295 [Homalodisca vitripennis]